MTRNVIVDENGNVVGELAQRNEETKTKRKE